MTDEQLQRIHEIEYSCDSRAELAERIVALEEENAKLRACLGDGCADCAAGMGKYADSICDQIKAENEKLREELAQWERLTAGIELPEYPITQFQPKNLERENAKLRELCVDFASMLTYAGLDGLSVEATIDGITKTYDASELCDKVEEIRDKED